MKSFEEYGNKYETVRMERRNGIIQVTFHTNGGTMICGEQSHLEVEYAFADVGSDPDNKVVILTGTGDGFMSRGTVTKPAWLIPPPGSEKPWSVPALWDKTYRERKRLLMNLLDIEVPVICAVNGEARTHTEIALLCDIVLAEENTVFQDRGHFPGGVPPGDGVHVVYPLLMGPNRGRYFLLTGQELSARQALEMGLVSEVLPREKLVPRAWELADRLAQKPPLTLRYSKVVLTLHLKRLVQDMLGYGLALEGLAQVDREMGGE